MRILWREQRKGKGEEDIREDSRFADAISGDEAASLGRLIKLQLEVDDLLSEKVLIDVATQVRGHRGGGDESFRV
jgi:hypothetical protein